MKSIVLTKKKKKSKDDSESDESKISKRLKEHNLTKKK